MWELVFIIICVFLNAVLAGIEIAFVSVNKNHLRQLSKQGDDKAKKLLDLKDKPERVLSTIQIGITLLAALTGAIGGAAAGINIVPLLHERLQLSMAVAEIVAIIFVVTPITYLSVVIGEITPKALALKNPYFFAVHGIPVVIILSKLLYPIVILCEKSTKLLLKYTAFQVTQKFYSDNDYNKYERLLTRYYRLPEKGKEYMINLSHIQEKTLRDILLEWNQVECVTTEQNLDQIIEKIISSGHTRMPVLEGEKVVGLINTKEILALSKSRDANWKKLIRNAVRFGPDSSPLHSLNVLQRERIHMGIVEGDQNIPLGIVTIEDIMEEVLGEIYDEDDEGSLEQILGRKE